MRIPAARHFVSSAGVLAALAASSAAQAAPQSPLAHARTIHTEETFFIFGDGKLIPIYQIKADIAKPASFHVTMTPASRKGESKSVLVGDGKVTHEVNGFQHTYQTIATPAAGEAPSSEISHMAALDLLLNPDAAPVSENVKCSVTSVMLDGRAMILRADTYPPRSFGGRPPITEIHQIWTNAKTGLPYRRATYVQQGGKSYVEDQTDFHTWALDQPIGAKQFAWTPPTDAKEYVEPKLLPVGAPAPDFSANGPDGSPIKLSSLKGKTVVLDFWATWCGPCQASMPHLEKVYQQIKDKDVTVLAVCVWDKKDEYDKWIAAKKGVYSFPTAYDPAGRGAASIAGGLYHVAGIPTQYVIDKDGKIAASSVGFTEGTHALEDALKSLGIAMDAPAKSASR